jgi:5'-phosphate synthase pdxT subunit
MSQAVAAEGTRVGVLAIQGAVDKHFAMLERLGVRGVRVLGKEDLTGLRGLIIPGGESTTISKGLDRLGLFEPIRAFARAGGRILGTCAGAILLARECENHPVPTLELLDVRAVRNAYGTQVDSFVAQADPGAAANLEGMGCVFIRAPQIADPGPEVEVLLRVDGLPVLVRQGRILASTFHPELADDPRLHALMLGL